uniref:Uncharacterized protein n=1 Tax=Varanus komodoensis TaxID=61221 RepID=A0A8D2KUM8_VARKO
RAAAAWDGRRPLQGAMKLAKGALELDAGDRPRPCLCGGEGLPRFAEPLRCLRWLATWDKRGFFF